MPRESKHATWIAGSGRRREWRTSERHGRSSRPKQQTRAECPSRAQPMTLDDFRQSVHIEGGFARTCCPSLIIEPARRVELHESACRTNGEKTYSTPIFATLVPEEPQILRRWSFDWSLCDRLEYW